MGLLRYARWGALAGAAGSTALPHPAYGAATVAVLRALDRR